jgi:hypothetical protein
MDAFPADDPWRVGELPKMKHSAFERVNWASQVIKNLSDRFDIAVLSTWD